MNFALFATKGFLPYIVNHLEKDGHSVLFNTFSTDIDICIVENRYNLYEWYRLLKVIKKNKIKLINFINDIPFMIFQKGSETNSITKNIQQLLHNYTNRRRLIYEYVNKYVNRRSISPEYNFIIELLNKYINEGDKILDVGFGLGYGLNVLAIKACEVNGVDIDKEVYEYWN